MSEALDPKRYSKEDLEKIKLIEEIKEKQTPIWKRIPFISIVTSLIITSTAIIISLWQFKEERISTLEREKSELKADRKRLEHKEADTKTLYNQSLAEKTEAISERTIAREQVVAWELAKREDELKKNILDLERREREFRKRIEYLKNLNQQLADYSRGYKSAFIKSFVEENTTVQADINKFARPESRKEFEMWLKRDLLFTAFTRYEERLLDQVKMASDGLKK